MLGYFIKQLVIFQIFRIFRERGVGKTERRVKIDSRQLANGYPSKGAKCEGRKDADATISHGGAQQKFANAFVDLASSDFI